MTWRAAAVALLGVIAGQAQSHTGGDGPFPVTCKDMVVGELEIKVGIVTISGGPPPVTRPGMTATFSPTEPLKLSDVYTKCGVVGFNWLQVVTSTVHMPVDSAGNPLKPPFLDPPLGGYGNNPATPGNDTLPSDNFKMYYNVGNFNVGDRYHIDSHVADNVLDFEDAPTWPTPTQTIEFKTWLVGYDKDFKIVQSKLGAFTWKWSNVSGSTEMSWCYVGVPEPSTWLTMLAGFGTIGVSLRRRPRSKRVPHGPGPLPV